MTQGTPEQFRQLVSDRRWDHAIALLRWFDSSVAADALMSVPFEEQERLFQMLPIDLAATLTGSLPYYHAYVLLRSRPVDEVQAVIESMNPFSRMQLFEDLSGEAWRQLVEGATRSVSPGRAIIEARRVEKVFRRPDGGVVQVIAPLDLSLAAGIIVAVLGPSGSGKSTLLRILSGLTPPSSGEVLWHGSQSVSRPVTRPSCSKALRCFRG
jgi:ABC-type glutathione transport system ATPase component